MTLPANLTTGTVTGTLLDTATGAPLKGSVTFTPDAQLLLNRGGLTAHAAVAKAVTLGKDGSFTVDLIGTDNADIQPEGWTWRVEFRTNVPIAGFSFPLSSGVSVNIAALVPTPGSRGEFMFDAISDSAVASAINGPGTQAEAQVLAKIDSHLGGDATGVLAPDAPDDHRLLTAASANSTFARRSRVVVGPDGDYATLGAAFAAYPGGNVAIELIAGAHSLDAPLVASGVKNVSIRGAGRDATVLTCTAGFIDAANASDQWTISDLYIKHAAGANTDDCIKVDYPRRWRVQDCRIEWFGGSSIWYRGGIHAWIERNIIYAKDSTNANGFAGVRVDRSSAGVVATTIRTSRNYVVGGGQYGLYFSGTNIGSTFDGDIAESCPVGFRFDTCIGTLIDPYTEANTVGIQMHDSVVICIGRFRDEPVVTWASVAGVDRQFIRVSRDFISPGKGIIYGGSVGATSTTASPSILWGSANPEGSRTAVVGTLYLRTDGSLGTTLYVKESGTGNTGWSALQGARTTAQLNSATDSINNQGKYLGRQVFNSTTKRPVWASGPAATDPWNYADGTAAHTPV